MHANAPGIKEVKKEGYRKLTLFPPPHTLLLALSFNILYALLFFISFNIFVSGCAAFLPS
jgi:hypothetical protein